MRELWRPGYDPGDPDQLFLPDYFIAERARRLGIPAHQLLSPAYAKQVIGVGGHAEAKDLAYALGGRAEKPVREVVLKGADGHTPVIIPGIGAAEAAEIEDIALAVYEEQEKRLSEGRALVDFDELREREGLPAREEFDPLFRQALRDRIQEHRRNPVTDPSRQPYALRGYVHGATVGGEDAS